jgi:hypothetical protein
VEYHRPYWLTTRDAHGQHTGILRAFRHAVGSPELPSEIETLLRAVRPTEWFGSKITGVDLASDFVWLDDAPLRVEIETLRGLGLLNRLLVVDTDDGLLHAVDVIRAGLCDIPCRNTKSASIYDASPCNLAEEECSSLDVSASTAAAVESFHNADITQRGSCAKRGSSAT